MARLSSAIPKFQQYKFSQPMVLSYLYPESLSSHLHSILFLPMALASNESPTPHQLLNNHIHLINEAYQKENQSHPTCPFRINYPNYEQLYDDFDMF